MESDGDRIAGFEDVSRPAGARHPQRIVQFDRPVLHFALFILGVEMQEAMGIVPIEARHRAVERDRFRHIVCRRSVMGEHGPGSGANEHRYGATR